MSFKKKLLNTFLIVFLLAFVVGAVGFVGFFIQVTKELPDLGKIRDYHPSLITKVYSQNDKVFAEYSIEKRIPVPYSKLPKTLIDAIVAVEDSRFYSHHGVDFRGILRAVVQNIARGRFAQGGSTITQQLARGLFLSRRKTITRKLQEMYIAWKIEDMYTKEDIISLYFNHIYFGHGAYGVEAASKTYFGKSVSNLSLKECATIAGLPRAPNKYTPLRHPEASKKRSKIVLQRMLQEKFISEKRFREAVNTKLKLAPPKQTNTIGGYFSEKIRRYLEENYGSEVLYKEGLQVYTTMDIKSQKAAEKALREGLRAVSKRQGFRPLTKKQIQYYQKLSKGKDNKLAKENIFLGTVKEVKAKEATVSFRGGKLGVLDLKGIKWTKKKSFKGFLKREQKILVREIKTKNKKKVALVLEQEPEVEGALISIDPETGFVNAMVGGYDFKVSKFNRATQAKRQAGSAFKPFIYGTALENNFTLASILMDSPIIYEEREGVAGWKPTNYHERFAGPTTFRKALEHSKNVVSIKLLRKIGIKKTINFARRVGIRSKLGRDLSLALGTSEMSLLELTSAYGVFANNGIRVSPMFIRYIKDYKGRVIERHRPKKEAVLDARTNYLMSVLLKGVVEHGTGFRARSLGRPVAGKTGTTNRYKDAWFVGFSPELVAGVWVGYDRQKTLGQTETGSRAASPIWVNYMKEVLKDVAVESFVVPDGMVNVSIDIDSGMLATKKCTHVLSETFREEFAPRKKCDKHDLSPDRFMEVDLDSSDLFDSIEEPSISSTTAKAGDSVFSPYD